MVDNLQLVRQVQLERLPEHGLSALPLHQEGGAEDRAHDASEGDNCHQRQGPLMHEASSLERGHRRCIMPPKPEARRSAVASQDKREAIAEPNQRSHRDWQPLAHCTLQVLSNQQLRARVGSQTSRS